MSSDSFFSCACYITVEVGLLVFKIQGVSSFKARVHIQYDMKWFKKYGKNQLFMRNVNDFSYFNLTVIVKIRVIKYNYIEDD